MHASQETAKELDSGIEFPYGCLMERSDSIPSVFSGELLKVDRSYRTSKEFLAASYVNKSCDSVRCVRTWPHAIITVGIAKKFVCINLNISC